VADKWSVEDFQKLQAEREQLDKKLAAMKSELRDTAKARVKEMIKEFEITPSELRGVLKPKRKTGPRKKRAAKKKVAVKP